jgi:hypothetical protein
MSELSSPPITLAVLGQVYCSFKLACDVTDFKAYHIRGERLNDSNLDFIRRGGGILFRKDFQIGAISPSFHTFIFLAFSPIPRSQDSCGMHAKKGMLRALLKMYASFPRGG